MLLKIGGTIGITFVPTIANSGVSAPLDALDAGGRRSVHDHDERATMGQLFDLIEEHRDRHTPYPPSYKQIAERVGVSRQTLLNWRRPSSLPTRKHLDSLAQIIGAPYTRVLDAALHDAGYLPATTHPGRRVQARGGQVKPAGSQPRLVAAPEDL